MPYGDPDATDPMELQGVAFETDDDQAVRDMAECFIEEYLRAGFEPDRIARMFQKPEYVGPFMALTELGADVIRGMIDEVSLRWGPNRCAQTVQCNERGDVLLPVLDQ